VTRAGGWFESSQTRRWREMDSNFRFRVPCKRAHAPVGPRRELVGVGRCGFEAGRVADGAGHTWPAPRRGPAGPAEHAPREGGRRPP
jgi:hypothetical protein